MGKGHTVYDSSGNVMGSYRVVNGLDGFGNSYTALKYLEDKMVFCFKDLQSQAFFAPNAHAHPKIFSVPSRMQDWLSKESIHFGDKRNISSKAIGHFRPG